jgi:hypothetical protein
MVPTVSLNPSAFAATRVAAVRMGLAWQSGTLEQIHLMNRARPRLESRISDLRSLTAVCTDD